MASGTTRVVTGTFIGTGAALTISKVGFRPKVLELFNVTDKTRATWQDSMPAASLFQSFNHDTTQQAYITTEGVTVTASGFTIGNDGKINVSAKEVHFRAYE